MRPDEFLIGVEEDDSEIAVDFGPNEEFLGWSDIERDLELMGIDTSDPEVMHGFIARIRKRIKRAVSRRKRRKRAARKRKERYAVDTPYGTVDYTEGRGFGFSKKAKEEAAKKGMFPQAGIGGLMENPLFVVGAAAGAFFLINQMTQQRPQQKTRK